MKFKTVRATILRLRYFDLVSGPIIASARIVQRAVDDPASSFGGSETRRGGQALEAVEGVRGTAGLGQ